MSLAPVFDVVSVRKIDTSAKLAGGSVAIGTPTKACEYLLEYVRCQLSLLDLIEEAYQVKPIELDGPKWLDDDVFAVQAAMQPNTSKQIARIMLQSALRDRFGLRVHREDRQVPVYALVAAKKGIRLKVADEDVSHQQRRTVDSPVGAIQSAVSFSPGEFFAVSMSLDDFARNMTVFADLDTPIVNMTGLNGLYKFDLHWSPTEATGGVISLKDPAFLGVVQQQLGLRLEKRIATVQMLVVDHAERTATEN